MSPGNSFFGEENITKLLQLAVKNFGHAVVMIPDIPAIHTYVALGYSPSRARRDKAIPQGNLLRNRVRRACVDLNISDQV